MKVLSLFCGCGGLDMGFVKAGYDIVWANDFDKYAVQTYAANFDHQVVLGDINEIELDSLPDFDVLVGASGGSCRSTDSLLRFESAPKNKKTSR